MAITTSYWATDLAAMIADLPITAKFGSTEFTCAATELSSEEMLVLCGNVDRKGVRIVHSATAFTVGATFKAQARMMLKFPDAASYTNYEIVSVNKSPDLLSFEVVLKADNRA